MSAEEHAKIMHNFSNFDLSASDAVDIVVQCQALSEGYDNPLLSVGVLLRNTTSLAYFAQSFAGSTHAAK